MAGPSSFCQQSWRAKVLWAVHKTSYLWALAWQSPGSPPALESSQCPRVSRRIVGALYQGIVGVWAALSSPCGPEPRPCPQTHVQSPNDTQPSRSPAPRGGRPRHCRRSRPGVWRKMPRCGTRSVPLGQRPWGRHVGARRLLPVPTGYRITCHRFLLPGSETTYRASQAGTGAPGGAPSPQPAPPMLPPAPP